MTVPTFEERSNLTRSQLLIWTGQQLSPSAPLYNMAMAFRIHGPIVPDRFQQAFGDVVAACDALRTVVVSAANLPHQRVLERIDTPTEFIDLYRSVDSEHDLQQCIKLRRQRLFDPGQRMFESVLLRLTPSEFVWYLNQHHLITDAWSTALVYRWTSDRYLQLQGSPDFDSPAAPITPPPQYRGYIEFERTWTKSPQFDRVRQYWHSRQQNLPPLPELYGRRRKQRSSRTERLTFELGPDRSQQLDRFASDPDLRSLTRELTGLNVFLAVMFAWLHRVSGRESLSIGTMSHNRAKPTFRSTGGLFVELFPIVAEIGSAQTFAGLIRTIQQASLSTLSNAGPGASDFCGREPFNTVLNYITSSFGNFAELPVTSTWVHAGHGDPDHLLRLQVHDMDATGRAVLHFDFNVEAFDERQRHWSVAHFVRMLDAFLEDPQRRIDSVSLPGTD
ncbi:MAG: condensation domain-containing protein, partial [Planctomycetaceae bacterium]